MKWLLLFSLLAFSANNEEEESFKILHIHWRSDMQFGIAVQGDAAKTISPDPSSLAGAASVEVMGRPNRTYNIILPQNRVGLSNISFECGAKIWVSDFRSYPPEGLNGKLDANGKQMIYIGATREAISVQQPRGKYAGSFLITAVYP